MAHARRKVHDVHARTPTDITTEALKRIGKLYAIEAEIRGSTADERLAVRKEQTVPLMQSLYDWVHVAARNRNPPDSQSTPVSAHINCQ
jgi:transposase